MIRRPPRSTRTDTLFPYTTLFRSLLQEVFQHRGQLVAGVTYAYEAPTATEGQRRRFVGQSSRVILELRGGDLANTKGIGGVVYDLRQQRRRPLADQPAVRAIQQPCTYSEIGRASWREKGCEDV